MAFARSLLSSLSLFGCVLIFIVFGVSCCFGLCFLFFSLSVHCSGFLGSSGHWLFFLLRLSGDGLLGFDWCSRLGHRCRLLLLQQLGE